MSLSLPTILHPTSLVLLLTLLSAPAEARSPIRHQALGEIELVCGGVRCDEVSRHGQRWVVGTFGQRYEIALVNRSDLWLEAVVTVDGRSILDGQRSTSKSRGYLIPPRDRVVVDGWRVSRESVAAFRFTSVGDSYAARVGAASDVGLIRVDFYPERGRTTWTPRPTPWEGRAPGAPIDDYAEESADRPRAAEGKDARSSPLWDGDTRQGLGTQFGEERHQPVSERDFERASSSPSHSIVLRYDDRSGLVNRGVLPGRDDRRWVQPPPRWVPYDE